MYEVKANPMKVRAGLSSKFYKTILLESFSMSNFNFCAPHHDEMIPGHITPTRPFTSITGLGGKE
jgi:hypothetical protein